MIKYKKIKKTGKRINLLRKGQLVLYAIYDFSFHNYWGIN